jgi:hypothetical protein
MRDVDARAAGLARRDLYAVHRGDVVPSPYGTNSFCEFRHYSPRSFD